MMLEKTLSVSGLWGDEQLRLIAREIAEKVKATVTFIGHLGKCKGLIVLVRRALNKSGIRRTKTKRH